MLQIRLRSVPSSEGHGAKPMSVDTVTVACPDHLVLADLPVAKCLGTTTASSVVKSVGRRSRWTLGERVHFCVRCDFPIAVYGRLSPCDHAFCLDCARSDSICYLCDERIQKIQTIKIMEGIFICAAPHCLKSFLKKTEFESHIHETHANLLQSNADKDGNESEAVGAKQSTVLESTARAPLRPEFSPNSSFHAHDLEDRARHSQHRDQQPPWPIIQSKSPPPPFFGQVQNHLSEPQPDDNRPPGFERPGLQNQFPQQNFDTQGGMQHESGQSLDKQQGILSENPFPGYPHLLGHQLPHFAVNSNPILAPPPFSYTPFPPEGAHFLYGAPYQMIRSDSAPEPGSEHGSLLSFPPGASAGMNLSEGFPRPWNMGAAVSFEPSGQGIVDGFSNMADPQGRAAFFQGDYGQNMGVPPSNMTPLRQTYGNGTGTGCERYES